MNARPSTLIVCQPQSLKLTITATSRTKQHYADMSTPQDSQATKDAQDTVLSQSIANLSNSANALAELLTRVGNRIAETGQVDETLTICLVYLDNLNGQFISHVASAQEIASQRQVTKSVIEEVSKKLEQIQEMLEHSSKDTMEQIREQVKEQIKQQMELTSKTMSDDSKKMSDKCVQALALTGQSMVEQVEKLQHTSEEMQKNSKKMTEKMTKEFNKVANDANRTIDNATIDLRDQISSLEYSTDDVDKKIQRSVLLLEDCQEALTQCKDFKETAAQAKEVMVLTMEELKLAKEDMQRERLMFQDQHDRLEKKIVEMARHMEGRDAENKGLKALYSKLSSHALRSVQNATNFRDAQYKFLVDGFARFEQKIAFITRHIGDNTTGTISGKPSSALPTAANDATKAAADKASKNSPNKPKTEEEKIAELQKTINNLNYERDVLTGNTKLLELRLAKFEQEAQAQAALAAQASPVLGPEPDTPCPKTLKSHKSKRSLAEMPQLTLSIPTSNSDSKASLDTTTIIDPRPSISVESLVQPDLWERLLAPSLLSDEHKRRLRLIRPQVTGGLRLEDLFLRVASVIAHDYSWEKFDEFMKVGDISQWYCVHDLVGHEWKSRESCAILWDHSCEGEKGKEGGCLKVKRTGVDYGKVMFGYHAA